MKKSIYNILDKIVVKLVLHLLKVSGGFSTFLITSIVQYGFSELIVPALNALLREGLFIYDTKKGELQSKKLADAREGDDGKEYNDATDDILNR